MPVENAFVSGSLRQAIFRQDGTYNILDAPGAVPREALPNEIQWFRHAALRVIPADPEGSSVSMEQLQTLLDEEIRFFEGLDGLLVGMDPDMSSNTRRQAILQANEVLESDAAMARRIRRRFFVPADPKQWDPSGGLELARELQAHSAAFCYLTLANGTVDRVIEDINDVVAERFGGGVEAAVNRDALMRSELVAELSKIEAEHDRKAASNLVFQKDDFPEVAGISTGSQILVSLQKRIISRMDASSSMPTDTATENDRQDIPTATPNDAIINAAEEIADRDLGDIRQRQRLRGGEADIDSITRQIDWIDGDLTRGDAIRAENNLIKLMHRQADESKPGDIIKTLTSVATSAIRKHQHEFAQRVLSAIDVIGTPDAPAMCAGAELLRAQGHFENALRVLNNAIEQFPNNEVAQTAKAGTLRDLGQPEDALEVLDETIRQFPNNEVARNAKAGTLRDLGQPEQALKVLDDAIRQFPNDVVAQTAKAETLRDLGQHEQALEMLDETIRQFPNNVVAQTAKAETLRDLGQSEQALQVLDDAIRQFPNNVVALTAKAETLRELGRHDQALEVLDDTIQQFPNDVVAQTAKAEALRELGRHNQALGVLDETIRQFPNDVVAQTAKAETLRDLERPEEALEVLRGTIKRFPHNTVARNACGHLLAQVGELEEAEGMLRGSAQRCQTRDDWIAKHILAMAWLRAGRIQEALESLEQGVSSCPFADARAYFRTARPLAKLANHEASDAVAEMEEWESDPVLPLSTEIKLFRAHAYAENGDHVQALKVIEGTNATTSGTRLQERLAHALLKRYGADAKNASEEHIRAQNQEILNLEIDSLYPLSLAA